MKIIFWISLMAFVYYSTNKETERKFDNAYIYGWKRLVSYIGASLITGCIIGLPILMVFEFLMKIFK